MYFDQVCPKLKVNYNFLYGVHVVNIILKISFRSQSEKITGYYCRVYKIIVLIYNLSKNIVIVLFHEKKNSHYT